MIPAVKSRRGMTLAELMVSLALVAVMTVIAVSFVILLAGRTQSNGQRLAFQQDFAAVKAGVEGWMSAAAEENKELEQLGGTTGQIDAMAVQVVGEENILQFQNGVLSGKSMNLRAEHIGAVTFRLEGENGEYLLFCTVIRAASEEKYTFCVNPRVGEKKVGAQ